MARLEQLIQGKFNEYFLIDGSPIQGKYVYPTGKIQTLVVENSAFGVAKSLERMAENNSPVIPPFANAYVASEFNGFTQKIICDPETGAEKMYSVYAVQFYCCGLLSGFQSQL